MEKFQYLIMGMGLSLFLIGILAGGVVGSSNNSTVQNETLVNVTPPNVTETPVIEEEEEYELTPADEIAIREGEKAEEEAMREETEHSIEDETIVSPVETSEEETIEEPIETQIKAHVVTENKPVTTSEKKIFVEEKKVTLKKTVNGSGFVFVGTKYAGEEVTITI